MPRRGDLSEARRSFGIIIGDLIIIIGDLSEAALRLPGGRLGRDYVM